MLWKICTFYLNSCGRNREFAVSFSSRKEMSTDEVKILSMYMRNLFVDGFLHETCDAFPKQKNEGMKSFFLLIVSGNVILPFKCFLISFLLFAILVYSLWRKVLECFSLTYPVFDVIKAMWRFTLFKLEKSTVESNHPYWGGGVLKKFF